MDFGGLILLGMLWVLFKLISKARESETGSRSRPLSSSRIVIRDPGSAGGDATQREGSKLELLLRQMERALEEAAHPPTRQPKVQSREEEAAEDMQSLEVSPEVVSLESGQRRPERVLVDRDDDAEVVEAQRIAAAEKRQGPITRADHTQFDQRIRAEPADHTAVRGYTARQLREAVVWRDILGPPKGLE